jgi:hypothetical protein
VDSQHRHPNVMCAYELAPLFATPRTRSMHRWGSTHFGCTSVCQDSPRRQGAVEVKDGANFSVAGSISSVAGKYTQESVLPEAFDTGIRSEPAV